MSAGRQIGTMIPVYPLNSLAIILALWNHRKGLANKQLKLITAGFSHFHYCCIMNIFSFEFWTRKYTTELYSQKMFEITDIRQTIHGLRTLVYTPSVSCAGDMKRHSLKRDPEGAPSHFRPDVAGCGSYCSPWYVEYMDHSQWIQCLSSLPQCLVLDQMAGLCTWFCRYLQVLQIHIKLCSNLNTENPWATLLT